MWNENVRVPCQSLCYYVEAYVVMEQRLSCGILSHHVGQNCYHVAGDVVNGIFFWKAVLRIHGILVQIRISGSIPLTNES